MAEKFKKKKILIVEDESIVAIDIQNILTELGYEVSAITSSGEEAILETARFQPALVLMDIKLKGKMDGITAAAKIRERFDIPVIYLTAYSDNATLKRAKKTEPFGYIIKPFTSSDIKSAVEVGLYKAEMDNKLKGSEKKLRATFDAIADVITIHDSEFNILWSNKVAIKNYGNVEGRKCYSVYKRQKSVCKDCLVRDTFKDGEVHNAEEEHFLKDGTVAQVLITSSPLRNDDEEIFGVVKISKDITSRKNFEMLLKREHDFSEKLIDTAQAIVLVLDTEGRIVRFNNYMEKLSGYLLKEVKGKDWFTTFLPESDYDTMRKLFKKAVSDIRTKGQVNPIVTKDGREVQIEWYDNTLKDDKGTTMGLLAIGLDVTERTKAEEKINRQQKRLMKFSGKLLAIREEEKKRFALALHDEVGSMAVAINAKLKLVGQKVKAAKNKSAIIELSETVKMLKQSLQRLKKMSVDLRPPNLDIIGFEGAILEYTDRISRDTGLKIEFVTGKKELSLKGTLPIVLYRITQEALTNIQKHSGAKNVKITLNAGKKEIIYTVKDDGKGFSFTELGSKLDVKMGIRGMEERVRPLRGTFSVETNPGKGTEITVRIPIRGRAK